ncbi:hypothetical protein J7643_19260 [bacterium]|nr:hypothetical protein [bacterium]
MPVNIEPYATDKTSIKVVDGEDGGVVLKFAGTIDHMNPGEFLDPFLENVHTQVIEHSIPKVEADFTELGFLNSSGIKSLLKWIMKQMELAEDKRYPIKILYSRKITWQQTSLKAITYLSKGSVVAESR